MKKLLMALVVILVLVVSALGVLQFQKSKKDSGGQQNPSPSPSPSSVVKIEGTNLAITLQNKVVTSQENLPVLYLPQAGSIVEGQTVEDKEIIFATKLASLLTKTDFQPRAIRIISAREIVVYDAFQKIAVTTSEKEADLQVDSLQQTLAATKISEASLRVDGDKITKIDLRFEKPVITFK